jgi:hypothetical protein
MLAVFTSLWIRGGLHALCRYSRPVVTRIRNKQLKVGFQSEKERVHDVKLANLEQSRAKSLIFGAMLGAQNQGIFLHNASHQLQFQG